MKKLSVIVLLAGIISVFSCNKKEDDKTTEPAKPTYYFKAKINGTLYETVLFTAHEYEDGSVIISGTLTYNGSPYGLSIDIDSFEGTKIYPTTETEIFFTKANTIDDNYSTRADSNNHVVKITESTASIVKGEFSGTLYDEQDDTNTPVKLTEGTLNLTWSK